MKKLLMLLCAVMLVFGLAGSAIADSFSDVKAGDWWFTNGSSVTWTFDLDNDVLAVGDINSEDLILPPVLLDISFYDNERDPTFFNWSGEWEFASVDNDIFSSNIEVDNGVRTFWLGLWLSVVDDHNTSITIAQNSGDFGVTKLDLHGNYLDMPGGDPVPEPATILLMGFGLLGLAGYSRKRLSKRDKQALTAS